MSLLEAIQAVLFDYRKPLTTIELTHEINRRELYLRKDGKQLNKNQVASTLKENPNLFQNINGQIILVNDESWRELLKSYWYIANALKGLFSISDIQFIIGALFFYKRLSDLSEMDKGRVYIEDDLRLKFAIIESPNRLRDEWIRKLPFIDVYNNFPVKIFHDLAPLIFKQDTIRLLDIIYTLERFKTHKYSDEEFGNIFEYFIQLNSLDTGQSPIIYTPRSLRELMVKLLQPKQYKKIYDPVCGTAGLGIEAFRFAGGNIDLKCTDINYRAVQLAWMNLLMHGCYKAELAAKDCFSELYDPDKYDYIIGDLPLSGIVSQSAIQTLSQEWGIKLPKSRKGFSAIVLFILSKLNTTGKAVFTVSESFLFKEGVEKAVRELLLSMDLIESVISLPSGTFMPYSGAKASIIVVNKCKPAYLKGKIKFIQGSFIGKSNDFFELENEDIIYGYNKFNDESSDLYIATNEEIYSSASGFPDFKGIQNSPF